MSDPLCPDCGQPFTSNVMQGCHICNESDLLRKLLDDAERERDEQKKRAEKASLIASREATVSKVSLDQANQMIDSLTEERDRWTDDCLKTRAERDQLKRERDAAQAEVAALRRELQRIAVYGIVTEQRMDKPSESEHEQLRQVRKIAAAALATPSTAGERPTMTEAAAAVSQAEQNIRARLDALPSTAGERIETDIFEHVRRGMGCVGIPQAQLEAMERVCAIAYQINRSVDSAELWDALSDALGNLGEMVDLNAHAALEKGE